MKTSDNIELTVRRIFGLIRGGKRSLGKIKFDMAVLHALIKCHVNHEHENMISFPDIKVNFLVVTPELEDIAQQCRTYDAKFPERNALNSVSDAMKFIERLSIHFENDDWTGTLHIFGWGEYKKSGGGSAQISQAFDELTLEEIKYVSVDKLNNFPEVYHFSYERTPCDKNARVR